ncbi:MAG: alcohol dehydrogenase catalytic domain-containing protein [Proteobacteria bacterium]|nr:alcohol dehydrogenase catalytic domain-containing protein [Pseudomonadota bacterium]
MKAARMYGTGETVKVETIADPTPPEGWALVKVRSAGVCGTDLHFLEGLLPPGKIPMILGHEIAGDVADAPERSGFRSGDRVSVYNLMNCGRCQYCSRGRDELCSEAIGQIGFSHDGGFAEYVCAPVRSLIPLPAKVSYSSGAVLSCSGLSAVHAVRLSGIGLMDTVVVNGVGGVGLMVAQVAKLTGARVIAIADSEEKAALAHNVGIEETIVVSGYAGLPNEIRKRTDGRGADAFFELVGTTATTAAGLQALAKTGVFVIIGYTKDHIDVDPLWMVIGELRLIASVAGARKDLEDVLNLAGEGKIQTVIQSEMPIDSVNEALGLIRNRKSLGRNVISF